MDFRYLIMCGLLAASASSAYAQISTDSAITAGRQRNFVTETGGFKNRWSDIFEAIEASKGGDYNQTLRNGFELLYQNPDSSWSMADFTTGPALKAKLDAINALDPEKDKKAFAKLEAEIVKIVMPQIPAIQEQLKKNSNLLSPKIKGISLINGKLLTFDSMLSSVVKPANPNAPSMVAGLKSLDDVNALSKVRDHILAFQPCTPDQPIAAYSTGGLTALIDAYKKKVGKLNSGFNYGPDGQVYIGSPGDKPKEPQLSDDQKATIDRKMTDDVLNLMPKLLPASDACAPKPFQLRMVDREALPLERDYSGSPLVGTRISDGEVASATQILLGKPIANSFALTDSKGAALAAATLQFPDIKIIISDGKAFYLYRPSDDLEYGSKSLPQMAAMLKTTPINKGLTIVAVMKGFKNDAKGEMVNNVAAPAK
jgi:hypothetical protein